MSQAFIYIPLGPQNYLKAWLSLGINFYFPQFLSFDTFFDPVIVAPNAKILTNIITTTKSTAMKTMMMLIMIMIIQIMLIILR